jgi:preprotein translocase subunit SecA
LSAFREAYQQKEEQVNPDLMRQFEKAVMLQTLDSAWREHLAAMDYLRQGIHLRGYAQKNPKQEYKREAFELFSQLLDKVNYEVISGLSKFEVKMDQDVKQMEAGRIRAFNNQSVEYQHASAPVAMQEEEEVMLGGDEVYDLKQTFTRSGPKVGRNDPCTCGSGKKYKQCHGKLD